MRVLVEARRAESLLASDGVLRKEPAGRARLRPSRGFSRCPATRCPFLETAAFRLGRADYFWGGDVIDKASRKAPARTEPRPPALPHLLYAISPMRFALFWATARLVSTKPPASSQAERPPFKEKAFRYPIFWRLSAAKAARLPAAQ